MNLLRSPAAAAALSAALALPAWGQAPDSSAAHQPSPALRARFAGVAASVVRIRTTGKLDVKTNDPSYGYDAVVQSPFTVFGTGVVIGTVLVDGRREYLVLTNHHVANASNYYVRQGIFLRERKDNTRESSGGRDSSFLVATAPDGTTREIRLVELAASVPGDMALLRTSGAGGPLPWFRGPIGFAPGSLHPGTRVVTSGFPLDGAQVTEVGDITEVDHPHALGPPHDDDLVDVPLQGGQSGSPVFLVERDPSRGEVGFRLVGLLHAHHQGLGFMVPYTLWKEALASVPGILEGRLEP